jgi:hypothetical protein
MRLWILLAILASLLLFVAYQMSNGGLEGLAAVGGAALFAALYFLPALVAALRNHHQATAIGVLNLLAGWTVLGWVLAIVWAFTAVQKGE